MELFVVSHQGQPFGVFTKDHVDKLENIAIKHGIIYNYDRYVLNQIDGKSLLPVWIINVTSGSRYVFEPQSTYMFIKPNEVIKTLSTEYRIQANDLSIAMRLFADYLDKQCA